MVLTEKHEYHLTLSQTGKTAVDYLAEATPLSRQKIKTAMQKGAVWLTTTNTTAKTGTTHTQRLRRAKKVLKPQDQLHFYYNARILAQVPTPARLISDQGQYSVWNKPYGMFSQGSKWGDHCTLQRWAAQQLQPQRPVFSVHRLDRAASGLMLLAHSKGMAQQLSHLFAQRQIEKHYRVWVEGQCETRQSIRLSVNNKSAISHITPLNYQAETKRSYLDVHIETGRKHQIRQHLASIGFPWWAIVSMDVAVKIKLKIKITPKPQTYNYVPILCALSARSPRLNTRFNWRSKNELTRMNP